jgi:hypothetical protein
MTDDSRDLDERFARIAAATDSIAARAGFEQRVMLSLEDEMQPAAPSAPADWLSGVRQTSGFALAAATLIAVGAVALAVQSQQAYDTEAALASTAVEVGW